MAGTWLEAITGPLGTVTKGLQELMEVRDLVKFGDTFRKMHGDVLAAQSSAMAGYQREASLLEEIGALKKRVANFETWDAEKKRYEKKNVGRAAIVYMLKRDARGTEPPHWVCAHCYQKGEIFIIQHTIGITGSKFTHRGWFCPSCENEIVPSDGDVHWLD